MADAPSAPERRVQMWRRGPESARGRSVTRNLPATIGRGVFGEHPFSVGGIRGTDLHPRMRFGARRPRRLLLHGPPTDRGEPPAAGLEDLRRRERQRICLLRPNPPEGRASAVKNPRSRMRPAALRHQLRYRRPPPKRRPSGHELTGPAGADAPPQPGVGIVPFVVELREWRTPCFRTEVVYSTPRQQPHRRAGPARPRRRPGSVGRGSPAPAGSAAPPPPARSPPTVESSVRRATA